MRILVCGGSGFIGSNYIRYVLTAHPEDHVVNVDALTYAANQDNLMDVVARFGSRYAFVHGDITDDVELRRVVEERHIDAVINFAAETHVDRSIHLGARQFVQTNVLGVCTILDVVRQARVSRFLNVSTDEVYGALTLDDPARFTESTAFAPNMPYAAAKAGGDLLCRSYWVTHHLPVVVTHCSNNYGPYQFPEKLIPFAIFRALADQSVPIYGDGKYVRDWIFVEDHAAALDLLLRKGVPGEVYNIGADNERHNLEVIEAILDVLGKPRSLMTHVADRPGHDRRYAIDPSKILALGWQPSYGRERFAEGLERTVRWYLDHRSWVEHLRARSSDINAHLVAPSAPVPVPVAQRAL
ncbi:dTDP-glucose 4,6-dehydratase [Candidatus Uhrbacteria bacterium]|nr:dTDP-glucose 4,6-dehydratase [Candidatus Uhrbacteria bacterium]